MTREAQVIRSPADVDLCGSHYSFFLSRLSINIYSSAFRSAVQSTTQAGAIQQRTRPDNLDEVVVRLPLVVFALPFVNEDQLVFLCRVVERACEFDTDRRKKKRTKKMNGRE